jgi:lipopolysaccharide/colanic/teichoic acid biosynthesis glycosyltransferase
MSLVGPRPLVPSELEHYAGARQRLLGYVRRWSLRRDLSVLARTIRALQTTASSGVKS